MGTVDAKIRNANPGPRATEWTSQSPQAGDLAASSTLIMNSDVYHCHFLLVP